MVGFLAVMQRLDRPALAVEEGVLDLVLHLLPDHQRLVSPAGHAMAYVVGATPGNVGRNLGKLAPLIETSPEIRELQIEDEPTAEAARGQVQGSLRVQVRHRRSEVSWQGQRPSLPTARRRRSRPDLLGRLPAGTARVGMSLVLEVKDMVRRHLDSLAVEDPELPAVVDDQISQLWRLAVVDPLRAPALASGSGPARRILEDGHWLPSLDGAATVPDPLGVGALPDQVQDVVFVDEEAGHTGVPDHPRQNRLA